MVRWATADAALVDAWGAGRFNLVDCIHSYLTSTTIHGDDVLAHANWEIHERWLKQYGYASGLPNLPQLMWVQVPGRSDDVGLDESVAEGAGGGGYQHGRYRALGTATGTSVSSDSVFIR